MAEVRRAAKADRPVEKYGDVDHQMKKVRIDGMRSQVDKNIVDSIVSQIGVMRDNADIYKAMFGEEKYRKKIAQLMNKLPGLGENNVGNGRETVDVPEVDLTLTSSVGDEEEEENYGTTNHHHSDQSGRNQHQNRTQNRRRPKIPMKNHEARKNRRGGGKSWEIGQGSNCAGGRNIDQWGWQEGDG